MIQIKIKFSAKNSKNGKIDMLTIRYYKESDHHLDVNTDDESKDRIRMGMGHARMTMTDNNVYSSLIGWITELGYDVDHGVKRIVDDATRTILNNLDTREDMEYLWF